MAKKRIRLISVLSVLLPLSAIGSAGVSFFFWHLIQEKEGAAIHASTNIVPSADPAAFARGFDEFLGASLAEFGVTEKDLRRRKPEAAGSSATEPRPINVSSSASFTLMHLKLAEEAGKRGAKVLDAVESSDGAVLTVSFFTGAVPAGTVVLKKTQGKKMPAGGWVAIVISGAGERNAEGLRALCVIEPTVTLAVTPFGVHSADVVKLAAATGAGLMLHLSGDMAPRTGNEDRDAIRQDDSDDVIRKKLTRMFDDVPGASGLMLEEGAGTDEEERVLEAVMTALRGMGKFHLGGKSAVRSRGCAAAGRMWVKTAGVDGFIDDGAASAEISATIGSLGGKAAEGAGVVIAGRDRPGAIDAFIRDIPRLRAKGVRFVRVSDRVR